MLMNTLQFPAIPTLSLFLSQPVSTLMSPFIWTQGGGDVFSRKLTNKHGLLYPRSGLHIHSWYAESHCLVQKQNATGQQQGCAGSSSTICSAVSAGSSWCWDVKPQLQTQAKRWNRASSEEIEHREMLAWKGHGFGVIRGDGEKVIKLGEFWVHFERWRRKGNDKKTA